MSDLNEIVETVTRKARNLSTKNGHVGEENTKAVLIDPVLDALGWDIHDLDDVEREYRYKSKGNPVDYALFISGKPAMFLEAKPLGANLRDHKWCSQVVNYANAAGVDWCVLTDGNYWHVYKSNAPGDLDRKLFLETWLYSPQNRTPPFEPTYVLRLLSKAKLAENDIEVLWKALYVDRAAERTLIGMIEDKTPGLVRLMRRHSELTKRDVEAWLGRAKVTIEAAHTAPPSAEYVAEARPVPRSRSAYRTSRKRPVEADTIVVPAREDGFQETFLGENRWYAIRLNSRHVNQLQYIAAYRVKPVSAITHYAEIASIEPWQDTNKWVVNFKGPAQSVGPLKYARGGKVKTFQGLRFTTFDRLQKASSLDEAFE